MANTMQTTPGSTEPEHRDETLARVAPGEAGADPSTRRHLARRGIVTAHAVGLVLAAITFVLTTALGGSVALGLALGGALLLGGGVVAALVLAEREDGRIERRVTRRRRAS